MDVIAFVSFPKKLRNNNFFLLESLGLEEYTKIIKYILLYSTGLYRTLYLNYDEDFDSKTQSGQIKYTLMYSTGFYCNIS